MLDSLRFLHVACAALSISGFVLRGAWMLLESPLLEMRPVRIVPHVIDTLFLVSGISLVVTMHLAVTQNDWLIAKFVALLAYIVLGAIALRRGRTAAIRATAFAMALATFAYIVGVAVSKSPASWLAM